MTDLDFETQLQADAQSLREIFGDLNRLEASMERDRTMIGAGRRGFFTPEEDNRVRQLLLAYRDHRRVLYKILERYMDYEDLGSIHSQLRGFIVAYGPFPLVSLLLQAADRNPYFISMSEAVQILREIRDGFRPSIALAPKSRIILG